MTRDGKPISTLVAKPEVQTKFVRHFHTFRSQDCTILGKKDKKVGGREYLIFVVGLPTTQPANEVYRAQLGQVPHVSSAKKLRRPYATIWHIKNGGEHLGSALSPLNLRIMHPLSLYSFEILQVE